MIDCPRSLSYDFKIPKITGREMANVRDDTAVTDMTELEITPS